MNAIETSDTRIAHLVRAGAVRVALFLPLYSEDPDTGALTGMGPGIVDVDLACALAARLGVDAQLVGFSTPTEVVQCLKTGGCDLTFMGVTPARDAEVAFTPAFMQIDYAYLVPKSSAIGSIADVEQPGVRVAVVRHHASTETLSRILKNAALVEAETPDLAFELLRAGQAGVMASTRIALLEYSEELPGSRVLDGRYGVNLVAIAVAKHQTGWLSYINEFLEYAKVSGLVQQAIARAGLRGIQAFP
jgi:polar amino acid transport system substrate-binding protein